MLGVIVSGAGYTALDRYSVWAKPGEGDNRSISANQEKLHKLGPADLLEIVSKKCEKRNSESHYQNVPRFDLSNLLTLLKFICRKEY